MKNEDNRGIKIGYIRVSTKEQNEARQVEMLQEECDRIYIEKASGKDTNRPELKKMLEYAREGDCIIVESYSRLARNVLDLLKIVEEMEKKGIKFISKKESIDTSTPQGKLMLNIFASLAQFEREQMRERQQEGIAIAKRNGKYAGRKPITFDEEEFKECIQKVGRNEMKIADVCRKFNISRNVYYKREKLYNETGSVNY